MQGTITTVSADTAMRTGRRNLLVPSLSDVLFVAFMIWIFVTGEGWKGLLGDGDTGWHIRTGDYILQTGTVPRTDIFSMAKQGQPWFAWEWLSDVVFALLHRAWGFKGVVVLAGLLLTMTSTLLFRHMMWRKANLLVSLFLTLVAMSAASVHFLARPHVFTIFFVAVSLWIIDRDRRESTPLLWLLVPLSVLWTNLHGGFVALIAILGLVSAGSALEAWTGARQFWRARRYALAAGACALATLANPYGYHLHVHVVEYLRASWILQNVQEFQSPQFRQENMLHLEALLFVGIGFAFVLMARKRFVEPLLLLFWAQSSLTAVRHAPLYVVVAVPIIAMELTRLWDAWVDNKSRKSIPGILRDLNHDVARVPLYTSLWTPVVFLGIWMTGNGRWPADFPDITFPSALTRKYATQLAPASGPIPRILSSDQWGDYLIYHFYPRTRAFIDGRSDFYGEKYCQDFQKMASGRREWEEIVDRYQFDYALVPSDWALEQLLRRKSDWKLLEQDKLGSLFQRRTPGLMKPGDSDERLGRRQSERASAPAGGV